MMISDTTLQQVQRLLLQHQKVHAIALVKKETNCSLKEAKDYVDQLDRQKVNPALKGDVNDYLRQLIFEGKKIEAIKVYKDQTGCSLADAKDYVEKLEQYDVQMSVGSNTAIDKILQQQMESDRKIQGNGGMIKWIIFLIAAAVLAYVLLKK